MMWTTAGGTIFLGLLKQSPSLKTKQCNGQQLCICGKSQTAGLDRPRDGWMHEWREVEVEVRGKAQGKEGCFLHLHARLKLATIFIRAAHYVITICANDA